MKDVIERAGKLVVGVVKDGYIPATCHGAFRTIEQMEDYHRLLIYVKESSGIFTVWVLSDIDDDGRATTTRGVYLDPEIARHAKTLAGHHTTLASRPCVRVGEDLYFVDGRVPEELLNQDRRAAIRAKALAKLTSEERAALGLDDTPK